MILSARCSPQSIIPTRDILDWVASLNESVFVDIKKTTLAETKWFYDSSVGQIVNEHRTFFQVGGLKNDDIEQPVIIQDEIGFLGMLCKPIDGIPHFLVQAKIEPGNVNKIQLSPTIQATKSNFTQAHGGAKPTYLDWFISIGTDSIVVDQIQSEQSSRFLGKRNRNIIIMLGKDTKVEESPVHKWMTLGQIKSLMRIDNLVNMDTRSVLSCIPFFKYSIEANDTPLVRSVTEGDQPDILPKLYSYINNKKMFDINKTRLVPLYSLKDWDMNSAGGVETFQNKWGYSFKVVFCDIFIDGREVRHWGQPLFEAEGMAIFGLFTRVNDGIQEFLIHAKQEVGCLDHIELGPTVQLESTEEAIDQIDKAFVECYNTKKGVMYDVILSEEGGRFYHEQNKNVIIEIGPELIADPPPGYWWCTYRTLNKLVQINNILNIQLRNLLSLLEIIE